MIDKINVVPSKKIDKFVLVNYDYTNNYDEGYAIMNDGFTLGDNTINNAIIDAIDDGHNSRSFGVYRLCKLTNDEVIRMIKEYISTEDGEDKVYRMCDYTPNEADIDNKSKLIISETEEAMRDE
jgi:hypothetical protein